MSHAKQGRDSVVAPSSSLLQQHQQYQQQQVLDAKLPETVCEVIPSVLYISGSRGLPELLLKYRVRFVVRCEEEPLDAQSIVDRPWLAQQRERIAAEMHKDDEAHKHCHHPSANDDGRTDQVDAQVEEDDDTLCPHRHPLLSIAERVSRISDTDLLAHRPEDNVVHVYHCPMEDTLDFDLSSSAAFSEALNFLDGALEPFGLSISEDGNVSVAMMAEDEDEQTDLDDTDKERHEGGKVTVTTTTAPPDTTQQQQQSQNDEVNRSRRPPAVVVQCFAGRSRSPTVVMAYLMTRYGLSLQKSLDMLSPVCRPNPNFIRQLAALEAVALGGDKQGTLLPLSPSFDLVGYYVDGLASMYPFLDEDLVRYVLQQECHGDVEAARMSLTRRAFEVKKHEVAVECLLQIVNEKERDGDANGNEVASMEKPQVEVAGTSPAALALLTREDVKRVYESCGRNRHAALQQLLLFKQQQQQHMKALCGSGGGSKSEGT